MAKDYDTRQHRHEIPKPVPGRRAEIATFSVRWDVLIRGNAVRGSVFPV